MPTTSTTVKFGFYAMAIKESSSPAFPDIQPFAKVADLKTEAIQKTLYSTYEQDYWLLNGNFKFVPTNTEKIHIGLMSLLMSGADGVFDSAPVLTIEFPQNYTTNGLTLKFAQSSNDYADNINVLFYNADDLLMRNDAYSPTGYEFSTLQECSDFRKIVIVFNATNNPYRYLRLASIDYGDLITFSGGDVKSAVVVEQISPLSIELPINVLELSLFSNNTAFNITDPEGDYFDLQNNQPLDIYEAVDDDQIYIGRYYLSEWENKSDNEINFRAVDIIGALDSYQFLGGIYTSKPLTELLSDMFGAIGTPYELDTDLSAETVTGWIPACSYREALQLISFAVGAYVTSARNSIIQIKQTIITTEYGVYDATITKADKGSQQSLSIKPLVTGVEVLSHDYSANTDVIELYNGTLAIGSYTIIFNEPAHDLSVSGAAVTASGANYAVITVSVAGTVVLSGEKYTDAIQTTGVYNLTLDANVKKNILIIAAATLINAANANATAQRIYDYYAQRYWQKAKLFAPRVEVGNSVLIDTLNNRKLKGRMEKMTLDLSGGFTAQAEIIGVIA